MLFAAAGSDPVQDFFQGLQFELGDYNRRDFRFVEDPYRRAAGRGYAPAQNNLACVLECPPFGRGNDVEAEEWYRKAALQGNANASYNLGRMCLIGRGTRAGDLAQAFPWLLLAGQSGHAKAGYRLGILFENGLGTQRDPCQARRWYERAAGQGHAGAMLRLGALLWERGSAEGRETGVRWIRKAAAMRHPWALLSAGGLALAGPDDPGGFSRALGFFEAAARLGLAEAYAALAWAAGEGGWFEALRDPVAAVAWLLLAAEQLDDEHICARLDETLAGLDRAQRAEAHFRAGHWCHIGLRVPQNDGLALEFYEPAADAGHAEAQYYLGAMREAGWGVRHDREEALRWYRQAEARGHEAAGCALRRLGPSGAPRPPRGFAGHTLGKALGFGAFSSVYAIEGGESTRCIKIARMSGDKAPPRLPLPWNAPMPSGFITPDWHQAGGVWMDTGSLGFGALSDDAVRETFRQEAQFLERAGKVFRLFPALKGYGESSGRPYLLMESLGDGVLRRCLGWPRPEEAPPYWPDSGRFLLRQLARFREVWPDFCHGDLKPENIILYGDYFRLIDPGYRGDGTGPGRLLRTLTPAYNPLALSGPQADTCGLAIILFEAATGIAPFADYERPLLSSDGGRDEASLRREAGEFLALGRFDSWRFRPYLARLLEWIRTPPSYDEMAEGLKPFMLGPEDQQ